MFLPQVIFLLAIFGYMNFMIFLKWFKYDSDSSGCAPSVLITLINMFMLKQAGSDDPCYLTEELYPNQYYVQVILLLMALLCIPWMLLLEPFHLRAEHNRK